MATSIKRKIDYYKITAQGGDNGLFGEKLAEIVSNIAPVDREVDYHGSKANFHASLDEDGYIRGCIHQLRFSSPTKRKVGDTNTKLVDLEQNEGINEQTYFIYCPETSYICMEYNYHGPKIGMLINIVNGLYKKHLESNPVRSSYELVRRGGTIKKAYESHDIRSVVVKPVDPITAGLDEDADYPAVVQQFKPPKGTRMVFKLSAREKGTRLMSGDQFKSEVLRSEQDLEYYAKLEVNMFDDETGRTVAYDLVKDKLQDEISVQLVGESNAVNPESISRILTERIEYLKENYDIG